MLEKIAFKKGLISKKVYQEAIAVCRNADDYENALKDYFIANGFISLKKLEQLAQTLSAVKIIHRNIKFGEMALKLGFIEPETLDEALEMQKQAAARQEQPKLIGKILFESGKLTRGQIEAIVSEQKKASLDIQVFAEKNGEKGDKDGSREKDEIKSCDVAHGMRLDIDKDAMNAVLFKTRNFDRFINADDIYEILDAHNIVFGVVSRQIIEGFIESEGFSRKGFTIAKGRDIIQGTDARISYFFETDYLKAGDLDAEGNIDFRQRGEIPKVEAGTLLAEKTPSRPSFDGRNIYGQEILAAPVNDMELKSQTGTTFSEDGNKIYAEITGSPKLTWSGSINVVDEVMIKGDVGYETGHVIYNGNIRVTGCLKSGFQIKGTDVSVQEIEGGEITADGNVTVSHGVNNALICSRGHVTARFIHNSTIESLGNIYVDTEIVDSKLEASGALIVPKGEVINSVITANKGARIKNLGTERTDPSTIEVGHDAYLEKEIQKIDKAIASIGPEINKLEKKKQVLEEKTGGLHEKVLKIENEMSLVSREETQDKGDEAPLLIENSDDRNSGDKMNLKDEGGRKAPGKSVVEQLEADLNLHFNLIAQNEKMMLEIEEQRQALEEQLDDLEYDRDNFTQWGQSNQGKPVVIVEGKAFLNSVIKGPNTLKTLKETTNKVTISEVAVHKETGTVYEILIA